MKKSDIIKEYNLKAKAFNDSLITDKERERNVTFGTSCGTDETVEEFRERSSKWMKAMILLPEIDNE